jgi:hypothetical protein
MRMTDQTLRLLPAWRTVGGLLIALVIYLSLTPYPIEVPIEGSDKYDHSLAYAALMFWFAQIHPSRGARIGLAIAFVLMGIALEFLQSLTDYRTFDSLDMLADAIGVGIGWLAAPPRSPNLLRYIETRIPGS